MATGKQIDQRLLRLVRELYNSTEHGELDWTEGVQENSFRTPYLHGVVEIEREDYPVYEDDLNMISHWRSRYNLRVYDAGGTMRIETNDGEVEQILDPSPFGQPPSQLLSRIHRRASQYASKVDDFLNGMLKPSNNKDGDT